jgi:hypothetical protein
MPGEEHHNRSLGRFPIVPRERMPSQCAELDTWTLSACTGLQYVNDGGVVAVTMKLVAGDAHWVLLRLEGVKKLVVPPMTPSFWLHEVEIEDVRSRGWEGIAFALESAKSDGGELECHCETVVYVASSWEIVT